MVEYCFQSEFVYRVGYLRAIKNLALSRFLEKYLRSLPPKSCPVETDRKIVGRLWRHSKTQPVGAGGGRPCRKLRFFICPFYLHVFTV